MQTVADRPEAPTAIRTDLGAIFVSLELSRSTWLITSLSPGGGEKMSKQVVRGGDVAGLLERFARLREKARARTGKVFPFVVIQEAGLDGFWIDRALQNEGIESHVVDPASIATSRRRRRAKTDGIDGEVLVRALLAYKRGEPRVCAMIKAPTPKPLSRFTDWAKIVDAICKVLRPQSAVPCNLFDHENARPLLLMDSNANQIPFRSRFDSISFRKSGASRLDRCCLGILHG